MRSAQRIRNTGSFLKCLWLLISLGAWSDMSLAQLKCYDGIRDDSNWIATGHDLYSSIKCLEEREDGPQKTHDAGQVVGTGELVTAIAYQHFFIIPMVMKSSSKSSIIHFHFVNHVPETKHMTLKFINEQNQKIHSMRLSSRENIKESVNLAHIKQLPNDYKGYTVIQFDPTTDYEPLIPMIYAVNTQQKMTSSGA